MLLKCHALKFLTRNCIFYFTSVLISALLIAESNTKEKEQDNDKLCKEYP